MRGGCLREVLVREILYDLEMKTHEQNRNNKRTENIERFDWFIERALHLVGYANAWVKKLYARERSRNQPILRFDVILQHDWPIEQCLLHIRVFFGGKTKRPCFDLFIHWLIKQTTWSGVYERRSPFQMSCFQVSVSMPNA